MSRRGFVTVTQPGAVASGVPFNLLGTAVPNGTTIEVGFDNTGQLDEPPAALGYAAITSDVNGGWAYNGLSLTTGTWVVWVRRQAYPQVRARSAKIVVP